MDCVVSTLTRRARGGVARRDIDISAATIRIGRGAECEIYLADPRIPLHAAEIVEQPGGMFMQSVPPFDLRANGAPTRAAKLKLGDKLAVGPYDLEVVEAPVGKQFALTVELARPLGDDLEQLRSRSHTSLAETWLSKRRTAWGLFLAVVALFLALPIAGYFGKAGQKLSEPPAGAMARFDQTWLSGTISGAHNFFGDRCETCHQKPFEQVADRACVACHVATRHHAEAKRFEQAAAGATPACQSCHKEHNGRQAIVLSDQRFCAGCHSELKGRLADTKLQDASDFLTNHPQFRPSVMTDFRAPDGGRIERVSLADAGKGADGKPRLREVSGLRFPHAVHLTRMTVADRDGKPRQGVNSPSGRRLLDCKDCHQQEPGGAGFLPIDMETHCQECHPIKLTPERSLPHAKPKEVQDIGRDYYYRVALENAAYRDPQAREAEPRMLQPRRPGRPESREELAEAAAWAEEQRKAFVRYAGEALCGYCHNTTIAASGEWDVQRPKVVNRWLPLGKFDHKSHDTVACSGCHQGQANEVAAEGAPLGAGQVWVASAACERVAVQKELLADNPLPSLCSADVLLPKIETCQQCHGGERAANLVPSTCVMCHEFHIDRMAPMQGKPQAAAIVK
ncbi:MAG: cytochrome c3 family protein [Alphaproteobacteria bacterium]|nr:cytochrome c3 family protein [Alphaproteobacteria bacterium]